MAAHYAGAHPATPAWSEPPWSGWIETTGDALLILEAARRGLIPRVTRRLVDTERKMITSGSVFVFDEDESGIKRWTDGFYWSPSRILGNFLLYRETDKRGAGGRSAKQRQVVEPDNTTLVDGALSRPKSLPGHLGVSKQRERTLVGSLTDIYKFKQDGLMKKTFSLSIGGVSQHLISYYKVEDVQSGRLRSPSSLPELASLAISQEYLDKTHFRNPPKVEMGADGVLRYRGEADESDAPSPRTGPLTGLPLSVRREASEDLASKRTKRFEPYSRPHALLSKRQPSALVTKPLPESAEASQPPQPQSQQDVTTIPAASPTSPQEAQAPQASTDPSPPATASPPTPTVATPPTAPYPSLGVAPYYGYAQPQPPSRIAIYPPHPGYPSGQSLLPLPTHYIYPGYPPPASISQTSSSTCRVSSPSRPSAAVSTPDPSQTQTATSSCRTRSPGLPQTQTQTQTQVGYYPPHVYQPHPYYPPPPHGPSAAGVSPPIYAGYPPLPPLSHASHSGTLPLPPLTVWAPYGPYPPPPPAAAAHQGPLPSTSPPQRYSYPGVYPYHHHHHGPRPVQDVAPSHRPSTASPG